MNRSKLFVLCALFTITIFPSQALAGSADSETSGLPEALAKAYLEKKIPADTGSCLVDTINVEIIGISDTVPGYQTEVFYRFDYILRCNRGSDTKKGQGVLRTSRLRDGNWIDRETFALISK